MSTYHKAKRIGLFLPMLSLSFILLFLDYRYQLTEVFESILNQTLVLPVRQVLGLPVNLYNYFSENISSYTQLLIGNQHLQDENSKLNLQLRELYALQQENYHLRQDLDFRPSEQYEYIRVEIVQFLFRQNRAILVIDTAQTDKVGADQVVVDQKGLVGRIKQVFQNSSHVQMLSDTEHYISAYTQSGLHTIIQGQGTGKSLIALHIPNFSRIEEGETVYSSGLDAIYPSHYPIGKIVSVQHIIGNEFSTVYVEPIDLKTGHTVYILHQASSLENEPEPAAVIDGTKNEE